MKKLMKFGVLPACILLLGWEHVRPYQNHRRRTLKT